MKGEIFREYDVRGIVGETLDAEGARIFGKGFGTYLNSHGGKIVVVGRDNRASSPELQRAVIEGLVTTGCRVIDVGQLPTPGFLLCRNSSAGRRRNNGYCQPQSSRIQRF